MRSEVSVRAAVTPRYRYGRRLKMRGDWPNPILCNMVDQRK
jgi:hypothetical protein